MISLREGLSDLGEKCYGTKRSKERITALVGANTDGSEKIDLFIIGHSRSPHCFKRQIIPLEYTANPTAWMTGMNIRIYRFHKSNLGVIFTEYFKK